MGAISFPALLILNSFPVSVRGKPRKRSSPDLLYSTEWDYFTLKVSFHCSVQPARFSVTKSQSGRISWFTMSP